VQKGEARGAEEADIKMDDKCEDKREHEHRIALLHRVTNCLDTNGHGEDCAISLLSDYQSRSFNPQLLLETKLSDGYNLLCIAIAHKSLKLVSYLCLEFAPGNVAMHHRLGDDGISTSLEIAIAEDAKDIALFLHSLHLVVVNHSTPNRTPLLIKAFDKRMDNLVVALLKDPVLNISDKDNFEYLIFQRLIMWGREKIVMAVVGHLARSLNRLIGQDKYSFPMPGYLFAFITRTLPFELVIQAINHPSVDLQRLDDGHLQTFIGHMLLSGPTCALFVPTVLRLTHHQRRLALPMWIAISFENEGKQGHVNWQEFAPKLKCFVPGPCARKTGREYTGKELERDATPERFGYLAYHLLGYGLDALTLFLLYQDGYLGWDVEGDEGAKKNLSKREMKKRNMVSRWKRYFGILEQLPMEMQMLLCRRLEGSPKDLYTGEEIEGSLRKHLRWYGDYANMQKIS
jgi:hypothetical protein